jgi:hypothetical protein
VVTPDNSKALCRRLKSETSINLLQLYNCLNHSQILQDSQMKLEIALFKLIEERSKSKHREKEIIGIYKIWLEIFREELEELKVFCKIPKKIMRILLVNNKKSSIIIKVKSSPWKRMLWTESRKELKSMMISRQPREK